MRLAESRVLVTGAGGFIGSHLVEALVEAGASVTAFVRYNSRGSEGWLADAPDEFRNQMRIVAGDVRDDERIREVIREVDVVFHLAALIGIPYSYHAPRSYVDTNVTGTLNVLQAARDFDIDRVLVTSTSEVYGTAQYAPIDENHPRQPQSPYSASKISADCLAESFYRSFGLPVSIVRPFNTYGPRQSQRAVIPTIIGQLLSGSRQLRLGSLAPTRDLNFVADTCRGFIRIAESDEICGEHVNISSGKEISMGDLAHLLITKLNPNAAIITDNDRVRPSASEVTRLIGDATKIETMTGWQPMHALSDGLDATIDWMRGRTEYLRYADTYRV